MPKDSCGVREGANDYYERWGGGHDFLDFFVVRRGMGF
jgi:hypothetical protein